jgi:hypothetical protein
VASADDVEAAGALYAAAQLEELGILRVCDRLVELYLRGGLPIGATGEAAAHVDSYWLGRSERLDEDERQTLYARAVGVGFEHLLERLAAALAAHDAARDDDDAVTWAAGELRANIAAHVDEDALAVVAQLHSQLGDALAILSEREILAAYGARDPWQLADHLSRLELGGTRDVARHQALAASGTVVLDWLAQDDAGVTEEVADAATAWLAARSAS